jgi:hypothetical protein
MLLATLVAMQVALAPAAACIAPPDSPRSSAAVEACDAAPESVSTRAAAPRLDVPIRDNQRRDPPAALPVQAERTGPPPAPSSEWMIAAGAAKSVRLFQSSGNRSYAMQTVSWGRTLTGDLGPGALRGRFAWAAEVMPLFVQMTPERAYGAGVSPIVWRWNFAPRPRWSAFAELAMGGLFTSAAIPAGTNRANFTAHWGGGVRVGAARRRNLVLGYRFQHFSNGNQSRANPGVNSHVLLAGWSRR